MGIVSNLKVKLKNSVNKTATKVADGIANAAELSEQQIKNIEKKKQEYLTEKPNLNSDENQDFIKKMIGTLGIEVHNAYLSELNTIYTPIETIQENYNSESRIAYFDITKWILDKEENYIDKLVNVYHNFS